MDEWSIASASPAWCWPPEASSTCSTTSAAGKGSVTAGLYWAGNLALILQVVVVTLMVIVRRDGLASFGAPRPATP